jgi:hypothetical protein
MEILTADFVLQTLYSYYLLYILSLWTLEHDGKMFGRNGCTGRYMVAPILICRTVKSVIVVVVVSFLALI